MGHLYHGYVSHNHFGSYPLWLILTESEHPAVSKIGVPKFMAFPKKMTNSHNLDSRIRHRNSPFFMMKRIFINTNQWSWNFHQSSQHIPASLFWSMPSTWPPLLLGIPITDLPPGGHLFLGLGDRWGVAVSHGQLLRSQGAVDFLKKRTSICSCSHQEDRLKVIFSQFLAFLVWILFFLVFGSDYININVRGKLQYIFMEFSENSDISWWNIVRIFG